MRQHPTETLCDWVQVKRRAMFLRHSFLDWARQKLQAEPCPCDPWAEFQGHLEAYSLGCWCWQSWLFWECGSPIVECIPTQPVAPSIFSHQNTKLTSCIPRWQQLAIQRWIFERLVKGMPYLPYLNNKDFIICLGFFLHGFLIFLNAYLQKEKRNIYWETFVLATFIPVLI